MTAFLDILRAQDRVLVAAGFPPISQAWWDWLEDVYGRPYKAQIVIRSGRRAGKSTTLSRVGVCEALCGLWNIPPGDTAVVAIASAKREQAKDRLETIEAILRALGYRKVRGEPTEVETYSLTASEITIKVDNGDGRLSTVAFRVATASLNSVGFTALFLLADEVTRWEDSEGNNPTRAVLASLRPCLGTIPRARLWIISSAWSTLDEHYQLIEQGDTAHQWVFGADGADGGETWVMNPSLSIERTRELEPDPIAWEREYRNRPMKSDPIAYLDGGLLDEAVTDNPPKRQWVVGGGDFGFTRNNSAIVVASADGAGESAAVTVHYGQEWRPAPNLPLRPMMVCSAAAIVAKRWGASTVATDSHYQETAAEAFEAHGVARAPCPSEPFVGVQRMRVLLTRGALLIAQGDWTDRLLRQLKSLRVEPAPSGKMRVIYATEKEPSGLESHSDLAAAAVAAVYHATESGDTEYMGGMAFRGRDAEPDPMRPDEHEDERGRDGREVWG